MAPRLSVLQRGFGEEIKGTPHEAIGVCWGKDIEAVGEDTMESKFSAHAIVLCLLDLLYSSAISYRYYFHLIMGYHWIYPTSSFGGSGEIWTQRLTHTERRGCDTGRRWPSTSQGEKLETDPSLTALRRKQPCWFQTCSLQNCDAINFCCLSHRVCATWLR